MDKSIIVIFNLFMWVGGSMDRWIDGDGWIDGWIDG